MLRVDEGDDVRSADAGPHVGAHAVVDPERQTHRMADQRDLGRGLAHSERRHDRAAVAQPVGAERAHEAMILEERKLLVERQQAGRPDETGDMPSEVVLFLPWYDVAGQAGQGLDAGAFEAGHEVDEPVARHERATEAFAPVPDEAGEVAQAFGRAEEETLKPGYVQPFAQTRQPGRALGIADARHGMGPGGVEGHGGLRRRSLRRRGHAARRAVAQARHPATVRALATRGGLRQEGRDLLASEGPSMAEPQRRLAVSLALLLALATLWGASYSFIKVGVETIPPITLIAVRTLIAGSLILLVLRLRGLRLPLDRRNLGRFLVQACLNSVVPFLLVAWGTQFVDAGLATILNSLTPVFAFLINWGITRHEAVTGPKAFGVLAGLLGICLVIGPAAFGGASDQFAAQLAIVFAAMAYGAAVTFGRTFRDLDPMMPAAGSLLCGAIILIPVSLVVDRPWTLAPSEASLLALLALAVFSTALAFVLYFTLLKRIGTVGTTAQAYLRVPIGVGIGMAFLGETPQPTAWAGLALVVVSVVAMTFPARRSRAA